MRIIIVGVGLGGLTAALCFARHGHDVAVLEQRSTLSPQGSGINIRPGASRILHSWGLEKDLEAISERTPSVLLRSVKTGKVAVRSLLVHVSEHPDWGTMRETLIRVLHQKVVEAGADVRFGATVSDVGEEHQQAWLSMSDGSRLMADLVLAADGIRSRIRSKILADYPASAVEPQVSDTTFYGVRVPWKDVSSKPRETRSLTNQANINCFMGKDAFVISRWNERLQIFGALYGIKGQTDQKGMWDENGDINFVRDFFEDSCVELRAALALGKTCDRWKLAEMPNLPRWSSKGGRILLLGDSAHAMHPNAAQGYSQIIEDIGVLDFLITSAGLSAAADIPDIAGTWEQLRKPRAERVKEYAKFNTNLFLGNPLAKVADTEQESAEEKDLRDTRPDMHAPFYSSRFVKWTLEYDAIEEAKKVVEGAKARL